MNIVELLQLAKTNSGLSLGEMAADMEVHPSAISSWKKGIYKPGPTDIAYLADKAGLPIFEVLAEIEMQAHPNHVSVWQKAVSQVSKMRVYPERFLRFVTKKKALRGLFLMPL